MELLIDNTGLHSAARTIFANAEKEIDVKGLIQLSSLIIFSNRIRLAGLEDKFVKTHTAEILSNLGSLGVSQDIISIDEENSDFLKKMCKSTAEECANFLFTACHSPSSDFIGSHPDNLPGNSLVLKISFDNLVRKDFTEEQFLELQEGYLERKLEGATHYMFAVSETLRLALRKILVNSQRQKTKLLRQIDVFLRLHLNENIAKHRGLKFTPAIARAQLLRYNHNFIMSELSKMLDKSIEKYKSSSLEVPSLTKYLLEKGGGHPEKMIEIALNAREKAQNLRKWITKLSIKHDENSNVGKADIHYEIKELSNLLLADLGINRPTLSSGIEIGLAFGVLPQITLNKEFFRWLEYKRKKGKLALLTEISKETLYSELEINPSDLTKYIKR